MTLESRALVNPIGLPLVAGAIGTAIIGYYFWQKSAATSTAEVEAEPEPDIETSVEAEIAEPVQEVSDADAGTSERSNEKTNQDIAKWWKNYRTPKGVKLSAIATFKIVKVVEPKKTTVYFSNGPVPVKPVTVNKGQDKIICLKITVQLSKQQKHEEKLYIVIKPNKIIYLGQKLITKKPSVGGKKEMAPPPPLTHGPQDVPQGGGRQQQDDGRQQQTVDPRTLFKACVYKIAEVGLQVYVSNDSAAMRASPSSAPWNDLAEQGQWCGYSASDLSLLVRNAMFTMETNKEVVSGACQLLVNKSVLSVMPTMEGAAPILRQTNQLSKPRTAKKNSVLVQSYAPYLVPAATFFLVDKYLDHEGMLMPSLAALAAYMTTVAYMEDDQSLELGS